MKLIIQYFEDKDSPVYIGYLWASCIILCYIVKTFFTSWGYYYGNNASEIAMNTINCGNFKINIMFRSL